MTFRAFLIYLVYYTINTFLNLTVKLFNTVPTYSNTMNLSTLISNLKSKTSVTPKKNVSIGLDIGYSSVKAVSFSAGKLDDFCIYPISHMAIGDSVDDPSQVSLKGAQVLKKLREKFAFKTNKVKISLAGRSTIVRNIWVPQMSIQELRTSMEYELDQYIPFPVEDVYHDCYILEENALTRKEGQMRVILAVVKRKIIDDLLLGLGKAGLEPLGVSVDAVVLSNGLAKRSVKKNGENTIAIVDIGASKTIIDIVSDNVLTFVREVEYGTKSIVDNISMGLSIEEVEAEKKMCNGEAEVESWLQEFILKIGSELWKSFEYYEGQTHKPIDAVYLCGGGCLLKGIVDMLSSNIGLPVNVWNALEGIELELDPSKTSKLQMMAPLFAVASGLANVKV